MEYLIFDSRFARTKSRRFMRSIAAMGIKKGLDIESAVNYKPCKVLMLYGLGGKDRWPVAQQHMQNGGTLVAFDLGYWQRELQRRKYRVTINGLHPTPEMIMRTDPNPSRFKQSNLRVINIPAHPDKPIMLVGNAPKSIAVGAKNWTVDMSKQIRKQFPDHQVWYRPKPERPSEKNVVYNKLSQQPIEQDLQHVSLVVCRHSNVAIDACLKGVPVVATHGAAATIYPNRLEDWENQPTIQQRKEFLNRLAWWQWEHNEIPQFWTWFLSTFPEYDYRVRA